MYLPTKSLTVRTETYSYLRLLPRATQTSDSFDDDCFGFGCGSQWIWARWILFVFFLVAIAALAFTAVRVNGRRFRRGQQPIRGTAWFTPPSYRQSERQYHGTHGRDFQEYVPPYTETANENDMGYYDSQGVFHVNSKAEPLPPPPEIDTNYPSSSSQIPDPPSPAVVRNSTQVPSEHVNFVRDFNRYYNGTPAANFGTNRNHNEDHNESISESIEMDLTPQRPGRAHAGS